MLIKKLCVMTGTRAEYGLLKHLIRAIDESADFQLQLVVAAAHLLPQLGDTKQEITADGFAIDAEVDMLLASNTPLAIAKSCALGMLGFADAFARLQPDAIILLGDRFEALAAVQAAFLQRIPVIHLHGGELTIGAMDDAIRHAITKLSALHFVAHEDYARRVAQLGEEDWRIRVVGPMVSDALVRLTWMTRQQLADDLSLDAAKSWLLLTYHPETLGDGEDVSACEAIYEALCQEFAQAEWIWTYPNLDAGGEVILAWLMAKAQSDKRIKTFASLGQLRYLSVMRESTVVVGNSSSGLLEAPFLGVPTINIGERQAGRLKAETVFDAQQISGEIMDRMRQAIQVQTVLSPLPSAASPQILARLREVDWGKLLPKGFSDRECS
jgi:UDP-hydrolysing UDP-N-acetyl-D-glucosamine 2-epimerase